MAFVCRCITKWFFYFLFKFVNLVAKYILMNHSVSTYTLHATLIAAHMSYWNLQYSDIVPGHFLYRTTLVCMLPIKRSSLAQVFSVSSDRRMRRIPDAVCVCVWVNLWCIFSLLHYECLTGLFRASATLYRIPFLLPVRVHANDHIHAHTYTRLRTAQAIDHNVCTSTCTCLFIGNTGRAEIHFPALSLNSKLIIPFI